MSQIRIQVLGMPKSGSAQIARHIFLLLSQKMIQCAVAERNNDLPRQQLVDLRQIPAIEVVVDHIQMRKDSGAITVPVRSLLEALANAHQWITNMKNEGGATFDALLRNQPDGFGMDQMDELLDLTK